MLLVPYSIYIEYHDIKVASNARIKYFCDNESLIKTLQHLAATPSLYPKDMIRLDYDIFIATLNSLPLSPFVSHSTTSRVIKHPPSLHACLGKLT